MVAEAIASAAKVPASTDFVGRSKSSLTPTWIGGHRAMVNSALWTRRGEVLWPERCHEFRYVLTPFGAVILIQVKQFGV